jgi:hypothetical protein
MAVKQSSFRLANIGRYILELFGFVFVFFLVIMLVVKLIHWFQS